jgi:hypothetical protein
LKTVSCSDHVTAFPALIMITGTDDHDPPEIMITIKLDRLITIERNQ